ncbi:structural maintenance of chromosomes protein 6 [Sitodiplosis mosellana]|uniref:structural maintenance of chromosomes protein 6 n=1 Tax=Sitodiplosis mosellana TaxID=263140 RepID=UPI002443D58D|nr:structural maintenance of chromosomes protein 6 [Sitodiplosis mosellana]
MGKRKSTGSQSHDQPKRNRKSTQQNNNDSSDEDEGANSSGVNLSSDFNSALDLSTRSGKILTVKLRNFMCHANLTVDFNARTNLLIGQNGSGKSAILTALIIGLGSKANATNRSSSIKELIKSGESSATIEVHISNDGSDAYEYEKYGSRIVVVRQIAASGSSTYKLKSASGSVISTSRADLLKLILYMNIQVDNPVCVMTQDASRGFLRDSNPKKRYELFLKATQLDVIIEKLDGCLQQVNTAKAKFKSQQRQHVNYLEAQKKAHEKLNQFKSMEPLKKETNRYKCERAWLSVVNEEEFIQNVNTEFENARQKKDKTDQELAKLNVNDSDMNEQNAQLNGEIEQLQQSIVAEQRKLDAEKTNFRRANEQIEDNVRTVKKLEAKMAKVQETIATLEDSIQSELNSNKNQIDEMKQANEAKLKELNKKKDEFESILKTHRRELEIFANTRAKCQGQLEVAKKNQNKLSEEKKNVETRLRHMHASPKENLRSYGENMVKLVEILEQYFKRGKFKKMPIGPIANHIEVKNASHRQYVEDALGNILMGFCVDNSDDLSTFREVLRKMNQPQFNVPIICAPFIGRQYNVTGKCVEADDKTARLMDLIVADNPVAMNCLIDHCNIETILFTSSFEYATHITSKKENVPQNLSKVILTKPYSEYFPAPAYRSYAKVSRPSRNLRVNAADREKAYQNDLQDINEKIDAAKAEIQQIESKVKENIKLGDERRKHIAEVDANLRMLNLEVTEIESIEYPQEADVEVMQNEVTEQSKILTSLQTEYETEQGKVDELNVAIREVKAKILEIRRQIQSFESEIQAKQKSKDDLSENLTKRDTMIAYHQKQKKHLTEAMIKYEKELEKLREKLGRLEATALKVGSRIDVKHTEEQLAKLIKKNELKLNAVSTSNESLESVTRQAQEADEIVTRSDDLIKILGSTLKMIHSSVRMRMANVSKLKQFMVTRTALYFTAIMKLRDIDGTLNFDNDAGTLDIQVVPRDKDCANAVSKTTNLSGGERSYTTVAFLLSLWSCVDHPFYFLDEYDVFTDQVNRMFMTKLLLNEAEKKPLQYTFLTPQDTSEIKPAKDLSILRLENPNR